MAFVLALPFLVGGISIAWSAIHLPDKAGRLAQAELVRASLFAAGIGVGLITSCLALAAANERARKVGVGGALVAIAMVATGYVSGWYLRQSSVGGSAPVLPLLLLLAFVAISLLVLIAAARPPREQPQPNADEEEPTKEEQPQPLSPP